MDQETPVDAWQIWIGVTLASVVLAGVAMELPAKPAPDVTRAANGIDRVASSSHQARLTYEHDAREIRIDTRRISMRNDGGTAHAGTAFGPLTPVWAVNDPAKRKALSRILAGQQPTTVLDAYPFDAGELADATAQARAQLRTAGPEWRSADGVLTVRQISLDGDHVVLVDG